MGRLQLKIEEDLDKEINMVLITLILVAYMDIDMLINEASIYYQILAMILNIPGLIYAKKLNQKLEEKMK